MALSADSFAFVADLVRRRSAIQLEPGKEYLVESRLLPLARAGGLGEVEAYIRRVRGAQHESDLADVVEALTTNETSWFRDAAPFSALRTHMVPAWRTERARLDRIRVWSAACSTGQEPYSIAMTLAEVVDPSVRTEIIATDLSSQVLEQARSGRYSQLEVNRGLPAPMLVRYFQRTGVDWQVADELRQRVTFTQHNLLDSPPPGPFDVVFLRNVLIYFDLPTKQRILRRVHQVLAPGGFLVLGAAETTIGLDQDWERVPVSRGAVYRPRGPQAPQSPVRSASGAGQIGSPGQHPSADPPPAGDTTIRPLTAPGRFVAAHPPMPSGVRARPAPAEPSATPPLAPTIDRGVKR